MEKVQNIYCTVCLTAQGKSKFPPNFVLQFINCPGNVFTETLFTNCRHVLAMGLSAVRRVSHGALSIAEYRQGVRGARGWLLLPSLPCDVLWVFLSRAPRGAAQSTRPGHEAGRDFAPPILLLYLSAACSRSKVQAISA